MVLHHFTAPIPSHLGSILDSGEIRTTWSSVHGPKEGPQVVWLTDDLSAGQRLVDPLEWFRTHLRRQGMALETFLEVNGLTPEQQLSSLEEGLFAGPDPPAAKLCARVTVEVPDGEAIPWLSWSDQVGVDPDWRQVLERAGSNPDSWFSMLGSDMTLGTAIGGFPNNWFVIERPIRSEEWLGVAHHPDAETIVKRALSS